MTQRRIVCANRKGGSGKTVTAVNVAAGLSMAGRKVLLVDCDAQAHSSISLGFSPYNTENTLYDLLTSETPDVSTVIRRVAWPEGLFILPASGQLAAFEMGHARDAEARLLLATLLLTNKDILGFDYLILDAPPTVGLLTIMAMAVAREVVIPVQTHFLAMEGLAEMVRFVYQLNASVNQELRITGIIPTFYNQGTRLSRSVLAELKKNFAPDILFPPVRQNVHLAEAPSFGQSIFQYAPSSIGAADYRAVVQKLEQS